MSDTYRSGRASFADTADIDLFVATLERFERGEIDADTWRGFRLLNGVYGQRQLESQMLRIKAPQGILEAKQLRKLADVAEEFASGRGHVTTRQNIQMYDLKLERAEAAMHSLAEAGLTTKEACGNSIRNVTASPLAGVDPDEPFDVTPFAEAMTRYFLRGPLSSSLPRKFKIAFEGSYRDVTRGPINDISFVALGKKDGVPTFRVFAGGGTATLSRTGGLIAKEVVADDIFGVAEAIVRVFHRDGERKNRAKARLKWLIKKIGWEPFHASVLAEWEKVRTESGHELPFPSNAAPETPVTRLPAEPQVAVPEAFKAWRKTNVVAQKQEGLSSCFMTLRLGDISPPQFRGLADLVTRFSDGSLRTTVDQNLVVRHVANGSLTAFYRALVDLGFERPGVSTLSDVTSCAGAHTCALAVTASRGLGASLGDHLLASGIGKGEDPSVEAASIRISGCPNGCGQNHVASIGFQGGMRRIGGRPLPLYQISVGGGVVPTEGGMPGTARFARPVGKVPAHRVPAAGDRIIAAFRRDRAGEETFDAYLGRVPVDDVKKAIGELFDIDENTARESDFVDLGQDQPFTVGQREEDHMC